jgi:hypothetical protein
VSLTQKMEKTFKQKSFKYFVWTLLGCRVNIYCRYFFSLSSLATGINNTSSTGIKFAAVVVDTSDKFAINEVDTCVIDTGGKFATGVVDNGATLRLENISGNCQKNLK